MPKMKGYGLYGSKRSKRPKRKSSRSVVGSTGKLKKGWAGPGVKSMLTKMRRRR